jgi:hypothetical protein
MAISLARPSLQQRGLHGLAGRGAVAARQRRPSRRTTPAATRPAILAMAKFTCTLVPHGVPCELPHLSCSWVRDTKQPLVNGAVHYVSVGPKSVGPKSAAMHLFKGKSDGPKSAAMHLFKGDGQWTIAPTTAPSSVRVAVARSAARHPNTVRPGEWVMLAKRDDSPIAAQAFHLRHDGPNTEEHPFSLDDIGFDFFVRVRTNKLQWFVDPATGDCMHSTRRRCFQPSPTLLFPYS